MKTPALSSRLLYSLFYSIELALDGSDVATPIHDVTGACQSPVSLLQLLRQR